MGAGMVGVSGHLGGHLSYAEGVGVDQTAFEDPPEDWAPVMREGELAEGEPRYAEVHGVGVLVVRHDGELAALSNRCTHRGGALDEGEIADGCVTCPLHGSVFRLTDGGVLRGPAAYPQPRLAGAGARRGRGAQGARGALASRGGWPAATSCSSCCARPRIAGR